MAPEDPVPDPMGTDAGGLVGVLALEAPDVPPTPVSVLDVPSGPVGKPPAVSVLPLAGLPVAGVEVPTGVLVVLPTSLPLADFSTPAADGPGPAWRLIDSSGSSRRAGLPT